MALVLREKEVAQILTMADGVRLVEEAFGLYARKKAAVAPRLAMKLEGEAGAFRVMAASVPDLGGFGLKTLTGIPGKRRPKRTYFAMLLFDSTTGALAAMLPATHLTGIRTGAASAVATKHLARGDARRLCLLGAGVQGRAQVAGIRIVRAIERVSIYDIDRDRASALARELRDQGVESSIADSPKDAIFGSDVVASATTSSEPVIRGDWLAPGMHVNAVGANSPTKREVDPDAFLKSRLVVDYEEQVLQEAGDLMATPDARIYAELGEIVAGAKPGRESPSDITLFKSVGVAFEDVAVAAWVVKEASARGLGTEIDLEA